jgi:hypothetical protein
MGLIQLFNCGGDEDAEIAAENARPKKKKMNDSTVIPALFIRLQSVHIFGKVP